MKRKSKTRKIMGVQLNWLEQEAFNFEVQGSSPCAPTICKHTDLVVSASQEMIACSVCLHMVTIYEHRKTVEKDAIRDQWFESKGYKVIRIPHPEFKERYFSGKGFIDLLRE